MDEYLFIQWAKLQADRRRLEREQQEALRAQQPGTERPADLRKPVEGRAKPRVLPSAFHWRVQS